MKRSLFIAILPIFFCCMHEGKIDKNPAKKKTIKRAGVDELRFNTNHYEYLYNATLIAQADNDLIHPKHFQVNLPDQLQQYTIADLNQFAFFYDKKQCIFIHISLRNNTSFKDTAYTPSETEIDDLIFRQVSNTWDVKHHNMEKNALLPERKTLVIKKGAATILLYNIAPNNYNDFLNNLNTFRFSE